jgi:hypothetical protein
MRQTGALNGLIALTALCVSTWWGASTLASVPPLLFTTIDVDGAEGTVVAGVNDSGDMVGSFSDAAGLHGFLRAADGHVTVIDGEGASFTIPEDINNAGQVVGSVFDATGYHGFLRDASGDVIAIKVPGAAFTIAAGINDLGAIVGLYQDASGFHGFLRDAAGNFSELPKPGATFLAATDVDNTGAIVGSYTDATGLHGFLRDPSGTFAVVDVPGAFSTEPQSLDNAGVIVGQYRDSNSVSHGFKRDAGGGFTTVDIPDAFSTQATGSNTEGVVVGTFVADSISHGFSVGGRDVTPPTLTVPEDVYEDGTSPAGAVVAYEVSAVDDADPNPDVACDPASGSMFQLLLTSVSCTATDAAGNTASATFNVIVKDADWQLADAVGLSASWNLGRLGTSLTDKLQKAKLFNAQGKFGQACETLATILNQVSAQTGKGLTADQAFDLTTRVTRIRNVIGC